MKLFIIFFLAITINVSAQTNAKKGVSIATDACKITMSKDAITNDKLTFKCDNFLDRKSFEIENFKLKLPNHATIHIKGSALNEKAKRIIKKEKGNLSAVIFDIKKTTSNSKIVENNLRGLSIMIQ